MRGTFLPSKPKTRDHYARVFHYPGTTSAPFTDAHLNLIRQPLAAIGFHGYVPPGVFGLVCDYNERAHLIQYLNKWWNGTDFDGALGQWLRGNSNLTKATAGGAGVLEPLPNEVAILYPGEILHFGQELPNGVAVLLSGGSFTQYTTDSGADVDWALSPEVYFRTFPESAQVPEKLGYRAIVPSIRHAPITTDPPNLLGSVDSAVKLYGATHVRIIALDNAAGYATIVQAGETGTWEIWWLTAGRVWVNHALDNWDAAAGARGEVSETHTVETYEIPPGVVAMVIRDSGGANDFFARVEPFHDAGWQP